MNSNDIDKLISELTDFETMLRDAVDTILELRRQALIDRRDIKSQKTKIKKLEIELAVYKGYTNAHIEQSK